MTDTTSSQFPSEPAVVLSRPQPFEQVSHTADIAVLVRGESAEVALGRLVLAFGELVTAGAEPLAPVGESDLEAAGGAPFAMVAVDILRGAHALLTTRGWVPVSVVVYPASEQNGARLRVTFGLLEPYVHSEGLDIKAVTYHACRFDKVSEALYEAFVVFDI